MSLIRRTDHASGVVQISLANGGGNALSPELVEELAATLARLEAYPPGALLLDGGAAKLFSGGFDLPSIHAFDRPSMRTFMRRFVDCLASVLRVPCPTVVAVHSHAMAGGFILSLAFDLRIVSHSERLKLGLNEVNLGAAVPAGCLELLSERTSPQHARRLATTGTIFGAAEAWRTGYADELADDAVGRALEVATSLADKPGPGACTTTTFTNPALLARMEAADEAHFEDFLDTWFAPETQAAILAVVARLTARKG